MHQTIQHMNNLDGPLSKLNYKEQARLLPLVKGHPKTVELLDSYLHKHTVSQVLDDESLRGKVIEDIGAYFMDGLWGDLNEDEQEALGILAVFRNPLTEQDIQSLVPEEEALAKLKGYSLLQLEGEGRGFVVHPVVSEYVLAKIGKDEYNELHKKAADFYIHQHDELLKAVPAEMKAEPLDVLCAVIQGLAQKGMREQAEAMTSSLLEIHHHLFESEEYKQAGSIVNAIQPFLDMQGGQELSKKLLKKSIDSLEGFNRNVAMGNLALLLNYEGKYQEALDIYEECYEFDRSIGNKKEMATDLCQQALIYQKQGKCEQALSLEREGLVLQEEVGAKQAIVITHYRIAQLLWMMGKYDETLKQGQKGMKLARELGNQQLQAAFLHHLGITLGSLNRTQEAFKHFSESLATLEQIGDKEGQADSLGEIGKLLLRAGQFKQALDCFERALTTYRELGHPDKVAIIHEFIGGVFEAQGHCQEALIKYQEALQLHRQYGSPQKQALVEQHITRVKKQM